MIAQLGIAILSPLALWLANCHTYGWRRWACVVGLASQPFWYWAVIEAQQWGIAAVCPIYTWAWVRGFMRDWPQLWRRG